MRRIACFGLGCLALVAWGRGTPAVEKKDIYQEEKIIIARLAEGERAYQLGAFDVAFSEFKPLAEKGVPEAQNYLGYMYARGEGTLKNLKEAARWYIRAARQGIPHAQNNIAYMYANGRGVHRNYKRAFEWYKQAADQGIANAQNSLGIMYEDGLGVPQDDLLAMSYYQKAANQRHTEAQLHLGSMYYHGKGVDQDYVEAYKWFYLAGGSERHEPISVVSEVTKGREALAQLLTPQEIATAKRQAHEFAAKHPIPPRPIPKGNWKELGSTLPF